jgi:hypothetical protein
MDDSLWQDEAQLANMLLEGSIRSSSESSSPGFNFNSAANLKKNLTETFNKELSNLSVLDPIDRFEAHKPPHCATTSSNGQLSSNRPPLPINTAFAKPKKSSVKRVAVYLRIRPTSTISSPLKPYDKNITKEKETSTIEVINPIGNNSNSRPQFPTTIRTYPPNVSNAYKMNINRPSRDNSVYAKEFHFERVMGPETSQKCVYSTVAAPMIEDLFQASLKPTSSSSSKMRASSESMLLFSYGITNAGKTHTVLGDLNSTNQNKWGIIPRAISDVFERKRNNSMYDSKIAHCGSGNADCKQSPPFDLYISFFEIYNENVYDLIPSNKSIPSKYNVDSTLPALKVRECRGQILVRGLAKHKINSLVEGIELTKFAHNKRHTSSNNLNSDSSRSHFICQMQIIPEAQPTASDSKFTFVDSMSGYSTDEEAKVRSKLAAGTIWIVDLAGSERSKRVGAIGSARQKESTKINNSLMTLMRCLNTMKENGKQGNSASVVPFRESKLTHIFMGHFLASRSAARTAMMVNVNPSVEDFDETQHVLAYSRKAKLIEINQEELGMKRKQFVDEEYDHNGRKKTKYEDKKHPSTNVASKPKNMLSRMARKLSPKKALKHNPLKTKKVDISSNSNRANNEENEMLKKSLREAQECVEKLEEEKIRLLDELNNKEDQIRTEVAIEMEERLRETRTKHNEKYEYLRSVMHHQTSKTDISVAGNQLEELMDKVDECEKEMCRMNEKHSKEVLTLSDELQEYNRKLHLAANEKAEDVSKIARLEQKLKESNGEIRRLRQPIGVHTIDVMVKTKKKSPKLRIKDNNMTLSGNKPSSFQKRLRPRKPLETSTNQTKG